MFSKIWKTKISLNQKMVPIPWFSIILWYSSRGSQSFYGTHLVVLNQKMVSISWFSIILWYSSRGFHFMITPPEKAFWFHMIFYYT